MPFLLQPLFSLESLVSKESLELRFLSTAFAFDRILQRSYHTDNRIVGNSHLWTPSAKGTGSANASRLVFPTHSVLLAERQSFLLSSLPFENTMKQISPIELLIRELTASLLSGLAGFLICIWASPAWSPNSTTTYEYIWLTGFVLCGCALLLFTIAIYHWQQRDIERILQEHPVSGFLFIPPLYLLLLLLKHLRSRRG